LATSFMWSWYTIIDATGLTFFYAVLLSVFSLCILSSALIKADSVCSICTNLSPQNSMCSYHIDGFCCTETISEPGRNQDKRFTNALIDVIGCIGGRSDHNRSDQN
jgi:hypothetical protein